MAEHIGVPVEDLYQIRVPIDVDGKRQELSIGEWKDRVRTGIGADTLEEQKQAFAQERKVVEQHLAQQNEATRVAFAEAGALIEAAEKQLMGDMERIPWAALREEDPAEWSAKQTEFKERQDAIKASKQELQEKWKAQVETQQAEAKQQLQTHLQRERDALLVAIPEWRDEAKFDSERKELRDYLSRSGFNDQEIESAVDHRLVLMARKAMMFDQQQTSASLSRKKVAKVAKRVVSPGTTQGKQAAREDVLDRLKAQHKKTGNVDSAASLIAARRQQTR